MLILRNKDGDEGGGADKGPVGVAQDILEGKTGEEIVTKAEGLKEEKTTVSGLSKDDITEILSKAMPQQVVQQQPVKQERQLTQDEFDKEFNVFQPDDALLAKLKHEDPKVVREALLAFRDGMVKQTMTMAEFRVQQLLSGLQKQYDDRLTPLTSYVDEQRATQLRNDFYKDNEDLIPYEQLVDAVTAKMAASGLTYKDKKTMFEATAKQVREVVKTLLADPNGQANGDNGVAKTRPKMSTVTAGGQVGGGRTSKQDETLPRTVSAGLSVFD